MNFDTSTTEATTEDSSDDDFDFRGNRAFRITCVALITVINISILSVAIHQLSRSKEQFGQFHKHRVKLQARIFSAVITVSWMVYGLLDVDFWVYEKNAPNNPMPVYLIRAFVYCLSDSLICLSFSQLGISLTDTYFRNTEKREPPKYIARFWHIITLVIILTSFLCACIAFGAKVYIAWMVYLDVRQVVTTICISWFAYTYYFIDKGRSGRGDGYVFKFRHPNSLQKLTMLLTLFAFIMVLGLAQLLFTTFDENWNSPLKVSGYLLHEAEDELEFAGTVIFIFASYAAYWVVISVLIKWVWIKSRGVYQAKTAMTSTSLQHKSSHGGTLTNVFNG